MNHEAGDQGGGAESAQPSELTRAARRVAVVGAGPAGFYGAEALLREGIAVDLFERLPAPRGLVRYGVAPDHQRIKTVAQAFDRTAERQGFRFFGNVELGRDVTIEELRDRYDQVLLTVGAASDRRLDIRGEDLPGSHSATAFVGWYNAHPDFRDLRPNLATKRAVVIGMGNVAMDVARVLVRHPLELEPTDIADHALTALRRSQIEEVVVVARRGPAQAACDLRELREIAELVGTELAVERRHGAFETPAGAGNEQIERFVAKLPSAHDVTARRRVILRFCASPVSVIGDAAVEGIELEDTCLVDEGGRVVARGTGQIRSIECGLLIRSIGYRGCALPGVPFSQRHGTVPHREGRVLAADGTEVPQLYVAGWIKRGATGVIGTNKACAKQTVGAMLEDLSKGRTTRRRLPNPSIEELLRVRGCSFVTYEQWRRIDAFEIETGQAVGRVRRKLTSVRDLLRAARAERPGRPVRSATA